MPQSFTARLLDWGRSIFRRPARNASRHGTEAAQKRAVHANEKSSCPE